MVLPLYYGVLSSSSGLSMITETSSTSSTTRKIVRRPAGTYYETTDTAHHDVFFENSTDGRFHGTTATSVVYSGGSQFVGAGINIGASESGTQILSCLRSSGALRLYNGGTNSFPTTYTYVVPSGFRIAMDYNDAEDTAIFVGEGDVNGTILVVENATAASGQVETYYSSSSISSPTGVTFNGSTSSLVLVDTITKVVGTF